MRRRVYQFILRSWVPYVVLGIAMSLTFAETASVMRNNDARDTLRFEAAADSTQQLIDIRLNNYVELLRVGAGLFTSSNNLTGNEFRRFVKGLHVHERYPGIQALGFAADVRPARGGAMESRHEGAPDERVTTLLLDPLDAVSRGPLGFDLASDPVRTALERARDTGEPAASGKMAVLHPTRGEQPGFVLVMPVFRRGAPIDSVEQRRQALVGYFFGLYQLDRLIDGILAPEARRRTEVAVYDGSPTDRATQLYASSPNLPPPDDHRQVTHRFDVAGRPWTVVFAPAPGFKRSFPWGVPIAMIVGTVLSLGLFGITLVQVRAWTQERAFEDALRRSTARLREVIGLEREARAEAQAANHAKDEFLATLSHELRTPLNAMLGWLDMLRSGKLEPDRRDHALEIVERSARAQARLIEDLLDTSRIMTGKVHLDLYPLQLGSIVQTVLEGIKPSADAKGVRVHESIASNVPSVLGDAARLQQIAWNLLTNAIKFTPTGGDVYLDLRPQDSYVELRVRDTGVGIPPEILPHVFERFLQANSSTTRSHGGVGLGLAIVHHLVELHGGNVEAQSDGRDRGALFVARFPVTSSRDAAPAARTQTDRGRRLEGLRVLVVDDDEDTRELLGAALTVSGASVLSANSAEEALDLVRANSADVLVSDIAMPDVDGYALMRGVRGLPPPAGRIPAVAVTALASPQDREKAIDAGFQAHLSKPLQIEALEDTLVSLTPAA